MDEPIHTECMHSDKAQAYQREPSLVDEYPASLNWNIKLLSELLGLIPCIDNQMPAVWNTPCDNHTDFLIHIVDTTVCALHQHLRED